MSTSRKKRHSQIKFDYKLIQQLLRDQLKLVTSTDLSNEEKLSHINTEYKSMINQQKKILMKRMKTYHYYQMDISK